MLIDHELIINTMQKKILKLISADLNKTNVIEFFTNTLLAHWESDQTNDNYTSRCITYEFVMQIIFLIYNFYN